jgi:hypothetical protein
MRWLGLLSLVLPWVAGAQDMGDVPPGQVPIDDVWCTVCHFEEGDEFALSVHYQRGLLLCDDCHGGDPLEPDPEMAKAPDTGFIGKPARADIAVICARCHSGPAEFFAMGPHADPANPDNPTCITCHQNHLVVEATLMLMDTACALCHAGDEAVLARAEAIQTALHAADERLHAVESRFDSLQRIDAGLRRSVGLLAGAGAVLRQIDPRTHALDMSLMDASITAFDDEVAAVGDMLDESESSRQRRRWVVAGVWLFVVANVTVLWLKRRRL